jgi:hypothetical protein
VSDATTRFDRRNVNARDVDVLLNRDLRVAKELIGSFAIAPFPSGDGAIENERESDAARRQVTLRDGRITELERALEQARARADDLAGELAESQRRGPADGEDGAELARLRALVSEYDDDRARTIDVETTPYEAPVSAPADEEAVLQGWRLRYFEQRVRYLEERARETALAGARATDAAPAAMNALGDWRAREAESRAAYLEGALREAAAPPPVSDQSDQDAEPFAANADVDALLRWRLLYLERRVAHLQAGDNEAALSAVQPTVSGAAFDADRWKWRARYLEARVRHLEERAAAAPVPAPSAPQALGAQPSDD